MGKPIVGRACWASRTELKKQGIKNILVVDREPEAGGMPRFCHHTGLAAKTCGVCGRDQSTQKYYRNLANKMDVEVQTSTTILKEWFNKIKLHFPNGIGEIEAQTVLLATGVRERPRAARMIPGTRPQGIFTTGLLQRFVYQEHLPVGKSARLSSVQSW
ncbi:MAG: hypothetical protein U0V02_06065 [Anaerolineales bacterium]